MLPEFRDLGDFEVLYFVLYFPISYTHFCVSLHECLCVGTCVGRWMCEGWHQVSFSIPLHVIFEACSVIDLEPSNSTRLPGR